MWKYVSYKMKTIDQSPVSWDNGNKGNHLELDFLDKVVQHAEVLNGI